MRLPRHRPPVRKVFLDAPVAGASTEYWEAQWLDEVRDFDGPLRRLLEQHLPAEGRVLEAGCGQGEVVAGLAGLGHRATGVDLAGRALADCHRRHPDLDLAVGDIRRLPFADGTFDAVVSLGVLEHFEAGPQEALDEHVRVLADHGTLFLTVPARGWYRRWSDFTNLRLARRPFYPQRGRLVANRPDLAPEVSPAGAFHQYELPRIRVEEACRQAGLEVTTWQPFGVAWALGDSPLLGRLARATTTGPTTTGPTTSGSASSELPAPDVSPSTGGDPAGSGPAPSGSVSIGASVRRSLRRHLRDPVIEERADTPIGQAVAWTAARALAHMQLVVATKVAGPPAR